MSLAGILATMALAAPPSAVTVQGTLQSAGGSAVDGLYNVTIGLYANPTGGTAVWTHSFTDVPVAQGVFSLALPDVQPVLFDQSGDTWLGVKVEGGAELPRTEILSVPMALVASRARDLACSGCVGAGELSQDLLDDITASIPPGYTDTEAVAAVVASGLFYPKATALLPSALPANGLDEISNGLLTNQFSDVIASPSGVVPIPDGFIDGVEDTIQVPDLGTAEGLKVSVAIANSNVKHITIKLRAPDGSEYVLYDKSSVGASYQTTYPDPTPPATGNLGAWIGQNPKGTWTLTVVDDVKNLPATQPFDGAVQAWSIAIQTVSSKKVSVNGNLEIVGSLTGNGAVPKGAVMSFNLTACPAGWTELVQARGRVLMGLPAGGALAGTVGSPLADLAERKLAEVPAHTHEVDPPSTPSSTGGAHSHCINVSGFDDNNHTGNFDGVADSDAGNKGCIRNTAAAGDHAHTLDIGSFPTSTTGSTTVDVTMPYLQLLVCEKL